MKKLSDDALCAAMLFQVGPPFCLHYQRAHSIHPRTKKALDALVDAKVVTREVTDNGAGLKYTALARARTVGKIMTMDRAKKINLQISPTSPP